MLYEVITTNEDDNKNPYQFEVKGIANFEGLPRNASGYLELADCIVEVVNVEYPIHYELLCKRVAPLYGLEKVSSTVKKEVDYKLKQLKKHIIKRGDFFMPNKQVEIKPMHNNTRQIQHISTEELAIAIV